MRRILATLLVALSFSAHANNVVRETQPMNQCTSHLPFGVPKSAKQNTTSICREGYALEHDNVAKIPAWVAYRLTPTGAIGCEDRAAGFKPEPSVEAGKRAEARDYAKSGYDIGHMANSADMRGNEALSIESNVLSNAAPQQPGLNRVAWKSLETRVRTWAVFREHDLIVYVGPIYDTKTAITIGRNHVVVPTAFYKVLVDTQTKDVLAFIYPHADSREPPASFLSSLAEVQKQTHIVFPVPKGAKLGGPIWPVFGASSIKSKGKVCALR